MEIGLFWSPNWLRASPQLHLGQVPDTQNLRSGKWSMRQTLPSGNAQGLRQVQKIRARFVAWTNPAQSSMDQALLSVRETDLKVCHMSKSR